MQTPYFSTTTGPAAAAAAVDAAAAAAAVGWFASATAGWPGTEPRWRPAAGPAPVAAPTSGRPGFGTSGCCSFQSCAEK